MDKAKRKDHTKVCWSCGKETMQPRGNYFVCSNCGATYCVMPEFGHPALTYREINPYGGIESKPYGAPWYD